MNKGAENREQIAQIRARMQMGEITVEQAELEAQPIIDDMNKRGAQVAKAFGKRYKPLTFKYIAR